MHVPFYSVPVLLVLALLILPGMWLTAVRLRNFLINHPRLRQADPQTATTFTAIAMVAIAFVMVTPQLTSWTPGVVQVLLALIPLCFMVLSVRWLIAFGARLRTAKGK